MFAGVATVFIALIAIIGIIQVFHLIFGKRPGTKKKADVPDSSKAEAAKSVAAAAPKVQAAPPKAVPAAGNELVAVITAAISAASGLSSSAFRIASIQPEGAREPGFNTPVWGRIERFNRQ